MFPVCRATTCACYCTLSLQPHMKWPHFTDDEVEEQRFHEACTRKAEYTKCSVVSQEGRRNVRGQQRWKYKIYTMLYQVALISAVWWERGFRAPASVLSKANLKRLQDQCIIISLGLINSLVRNKAFLKMLPRVLPGYRGTEKGGIVRRASSNHDFGWINGSTRGTPRSWWQELHVFPVPEGNWESQGHYLPINLSPGSAPGWLANRSGARKYGRKPRTPAPENLS